jgi:hypothetical protein
MIIGGKKYHKNVEFNDLCFTAGVVMETFTLAAHSFYEQAEEISTFNWNQNISDNLQCMICDTKFRDLLKNNMYDPQVPP